MGQTKQQKITAEMGKSFLKIKYIIIHTKLRSLSKNWLTILLLFIKYCDGSWKLKLPFFSLLYIFNIKWFKNFLPAVDRITFDLINLSILKKSLIVVFVAGNTRIKFVNIMTSLINFFLEISKI